MRITTCAMEATGSKVMASNAVNAILFKVFDLLQRLGVSCLLRGH
jgi:hypothetical protein